MLIGYKLTDQEGYTQRGLEGETLWTVGATMKPRGKGIASCGPGVLHYYTDPHLGVLLNPVHANIPGTLHMFRVEVAAFLGTDGLKHWAKGPLKVQAEVPCPQWAAKERGQFAVGVAWVALQQQQVQIPAWVRWARVYLRQGVEAEAAQAAQEQVIAQTAAEAWAAAQAAREAVQATQIAAEVTRAAAAAAMWAAEAVAARAAQAARGWARAAEAAAFVRATTEAARAAQSARGWAVEAAAAEAAAHVVKETEQTLLWVVAHVKAQTLLAALTEQFSLKGS